MKTFKQYINENKYTSDSPKYKNILDDFKNEFDVHMKSNGWKDISIHIDGKGLVVINFDKNKLTSSQFVSLKTQYQRKLQDLGYDVITIDDKTDMKNNLIKFKVY